MVNEKNNAIGGEKQNKKNNGEQSDFCDLEQVTLKPQQLWFQSDLKRLQVHHYLTTWLQIWYHSLLGGDSIRQGSDLEKKNCLFGVHPAVIGKLTSFSLSLNMNLFQTALIQDMQRLQRRQDSTHSVARWPPSILEPRIGQKAREKRHC